MKKITLTFCLFISLVFASMFTDFNISVSALDEPEFLGITQLTDNSVLIEFDLHKSYNDVIIYRSSDTYNWDIITTIDWLDCIYTGEYVDKNLKENQTYYYKLTFYDSYNNQYGASSEVKSIKLSKNVLPKSENLTAPSIDSISSISATSIKLNFSCYENTYIYRKTSNTDWKIIATVELFDSEYVDKNLTPDTKYYYRLISYEHSYIYDCKLYSDFSDIKSCTPKISQIKNISATGDYTSINLKWSEKSDVTGYKIYMATSKNGKYSLVKTIANNKTISYKKTGLTINKKYYFKICGYKTISKKNYTGPFSTTVSATVKKLSYPSKVQLQGYYKSIGIFWEPVSDADGYQIYMSTSKNGKYSLVKTIANNKTISYKKTGLTINKKYYFKICGYKTISKKNYTGPFSTTVSTTVEKLSYPSKVQLQGYYKSIDIFWEPVSDADGYQIYMSTSKTGKYKCIKSISKQTSSSATIKNLKNLTNYYIKIRSYDNVSGKKVYSDFTKITKIKTISKKASDIKRTIRITKPKISKMNFLGGVDFEIYWRNQSSKKIKYLEFYVTPYNAVNDRMSWMGKSSTWCYITGPIRKTTVGEYYCYKGEWETIFKEKNTYSTLYPTYTLKKLDLNNTFNCAVWENVWYNSDIDKIKLSKIRIKYMDGTSKTISGKDIKYSIW